MGKKPVNSRVKGQVYERKIVNILAEWWGAPVFRRTPLSGGWLKKGEDGDIQSTDASFPFVVECKNRTKEITVGGFLTGSALTALRWFDGIEDVADRKGKYPMVVANTTDAGDIVMVREREMLRMMALTPRTMPQQYMIVTHGEDECRRRIVICTFVKFLQFATPDLVRAICPAKIGGEIVEG